MSDRGGRPVLLGSRNSAASEGLGFIHTRVCAYMPVCVGAAGGLCASIRVYDVSVGVLLSSLALCEKEG